ncbi:Gfo/Idh/MocA family protein [Algicella marina]|uniref:Gfo/Idh/MocA family oxidoreductase n=1 Tax=Algicella marina TaxID=2683284 RepID=A0A6P1SXN4_9RHOB|nr:Gfo/Idh/MocA family oxidoreductase [Algicella marina]QHQ34241.1 gfo/Idh/MocA family oxidoreductase [Algicella marina]
MSTPVALVGIGKIAEDQHLPAIASSDDWHLAATVSRSGSVPDVEGFTGIEEMLATRPDIPVISLCLPPAPRFAYAQAALEAGRHVMLEKPPGATLAEVHTLAAMARERGLTLFASWHSRAACGVAPAREWLADKRITRVHIDWQEDVREWHPGQDWVFEPGGMGVFDPGINALSILTEILPHPVHLTAATLDFPANRATPIAANLRFTGNTTAHFNWLQEGPPTWDIDVETSEGTLHLGKGGSTLSIGGADHPLPRNTEYAGLYARMAECIALGISDVDLAPMVHVADAFTLGQRVEAAEFSF